MRRDYETLAELFESYRVPLVVIGVGLFISFAGFFFAIFSGAESRGAEFRRAARAHIGQLQIGFTALNRELEDSALAIELGLPLESYGRLQENLIVGGSVFIRDAGFITAAGEAESSAPDGSGDAETVKSVISRSGGGDPRRRAATTETLLAWMPRSEEDGLQLLAARPTGSSARPWAYVVADLSELALSAPIADRPLSAVMRIDAGGANRLFGAATLADLEAAPYRQIWSAPAPYQAVTAEFLPDRDFVMDVGALPWLVLLVGFAASFAVFGLAFREARTGIKIREEVARKTDELRRSHEMIEAKNAELAQFAAHASHDLQAPLRAMKGMSDLLMRGRRELDPDTLVLIERLKSGADRAQQLVQDLLSYSRAESAEPKLGPVDFDSLRFDVEGLLEAAIEEANAQIQWDCDHPMTADQFLLTRLVTNLVSNAVKYRGSADPFVRISTWRDEDRDVLCVEDNGIGVPEEHAERIFQVFERLHSRDAYEGTGLGLALCRRVAELHDGRIWVEPGAVSGSRFFVALPNDAARRNFA